MATGHPPRRPSLAHTPRRRRRGGAARWVRGGGADRGAASESGRPAAERAPSGCLCWVRRAGRWRRGRVGRRWLPPEQAIDAYPHTPPGIPPDVLPRRTLRACGGGGGLPGGSVAGGRRRRGRLGGPAAATRRSARLLAGAGAGGCTGDPSRKGCTCGGGQGSSDAADAARGAPAVPCQPSLQIWPRGVLRPSPPLCCGWRPRGRPRTWRGRWRWTGCGGAGLHLAKAWEEAKLKPSSRPSMGTVWLAKLDWQRRILA